ncbi:hypothetical protein KO506_02735 [Polaribacter vadi]|uniref:hypothetical protein n=1 Tax=Polaribacter TaxID=52959 RepID=UPI001C0A1141|nr:MULTISPECIES: hypothetical protein [Polaribacter]MBU3010308.1 hypothetical protein [Polaribacter vadi]MDO6740115.1 hypothetical protein [Polaribacter sp. 1_MG-2023]
MKLYTNCKSCKKEITIKSNASTRPDLQMEKGDEFNVNCFNCGKKEKKHVNDIKAEPNKLVLLIGLLLGIFATLFLWTIYGAIGTVSIIIPLIFLQQQMSSTKGFNSYMVRRK